MQQSSNKRFQKLYKPHSRNIIENEPDTHKEKSAINCIYTIYGEDNSEIQENPLQNSELVLVINIKGLVCGVNNKEEREVPAESEEQNSKSKAEDAPNQGAPLDIEIRESSRVKQFDLDIDPRMPAIIEKVRPVDDTFSIPIDIKDPSKVLKIGSQLSPELKEELMKFLKANLFFFVCSRVNMVGINPAVMCHRLNIDPLKKERGRSVDQSVVREPSRYKKK